MRTRRWLGEGLAGTGKPAIYHAISRVVDRRFVFGADEKERFRTLMRMQEKFTGCRVLSYCIMCNHFHLLLEVPPMRAEGISDEELRLRLFAIYNEAFVAGVATELEEARKAEYAKARGLEDAVAGIHKRFTYRMHNLGEFMKGLLQRFTQWYNRTHSRSGHLWEDRFKSVIVEDGVVAKTIAAYIDLNPVRAGMVKDPADYRWSSYGEAIGGGAKGNGKTARAGLVRALRAHVGAEADSALWAGDVSSEYRKLLMAGAVERVEQAIGSDGKPMVRTLRKGMTAENAAKGQNDDGEIPFGKMLRCRIRYFTDGAVIGSREFVDKAFMAARDRFGPKRTTGARKPKGSAAAAAGIIWSLRDLRKEI